MKRVVSVSLGSSSRDHTSRVRLLDEEIQIERIGTDGSLGRAIQLIERLDGKVDAIGLGGINRYLMAFGKRYELQEAKKMARAARRTPVVDGCGLKLTAEPRTLEYLQNHGIIDFRGKKVLVVCGVDRYGLAETFPKLGAKVKYGDLVFALGIPLIIPSLWILNLLGWLLLPLICRFVPISLLYPTGEKQREQKPKGEKYFQWADIIAGDFLFIRRYMPKGLQGKIIITNTLTEDDIRLLKERGVAMVVTTTPEMNGRSFGINAVEAALVALDGKGRVLTEREYRLLLLLIGWQPRIIRFS